MKTRTRIKTPIFTAKANGVVIRRTEASFSTHNRTKYILKQLGGDPQQIMRDIRWAILCRRASLL
jgi:hypothetical protein